MRERGYGTLRRAANTFALGWRSLSEHGVSFLPEAEIKRRQGMRLRAMIRHAYDTVAFYRREMDARGLRPEDFYTAGDLERLPLINGLTVRRCPEDFISSAYSGRLDRLRRSVSASTQEHTPKVIYGDDAGARVGLMLAERDRRVLNRLLGKRWRQSQFFLLPRFSLTFSGRKYWDRRTLLSKARVVRNYCFAEAPMAEVANRLNEVRPDVVFAYGSYSEEFFRYVAANGLKVFAPRVWMYGGDGLRPAGREFIERNFGCKVYSTYNSTETGKLGFQCERREGFHLNVDYCHARLVDAAGRSVPPGARGEVVISNLFNRVTVLLNYRMSDLGVMSAGKCPCGRSLPVLEKLEGRVFEFIRLPDGRRLLKEDLECEECYNEALQSQVEQTGAREVVLRLAPRPGVNRDALVRRMRQWLNEQLGPEMRGSVELVERIPYTPAGKFRAVIARRPAASMTGAADKGE